MKIFITGADGQLGRALLQITKNCEILAPPISEYDITDKNAVSAVIIGFNPDVIFHCAAYTAVDKAEDEAELCRKVNVEGTRNIAECAAKVGAKMVYISSDYVFDGTKNGNYETYDAPNPQSVYGKSKLDGENIVRDIVPKHFIVRTSWVFGDGGNFVKTMLRIGKQRNEVRVVSDQIGSPTYTVDLARLLVEMSVTERYGTYHATNEGYCSWANFAEKIFEYANYTAKIIPISTDEFGAKAPRPLNSRLSKNKLIENGFTLLPSWENALQRYLKEVEL